MNRARVGAAARRLAALADLALGGGRAVGPGTAEARADRDAAAGTPVRDTVPGGA